MYYEVFYYENESKESWSSIGFSKLKDALKFYNENKNYYVGMEVTKKNSQGDVIKFIR